MQSNLPNRVQYWHALYRPTAAMKAGLRGIKVSLSQEHGLDREKYLVLDLIPHLYALGIVTFGGNDP